MEKGTKQFNLISNFYHALFSALYSLIVHFLSSFSNPQREQKVESDLVFCLQVIIWLFLVHKLFIVCIFVFSFAIIIIVTVINIILSIYSSRKMNFPFDMILFFSERDNESFFMMLLMISTPSTVSKLSDVFVSVDSHTTMSTSLTQTFVIWLAKMISRLVDSRKLHISQSLSTMWRSKCYLSSEKYVHNTSTTWYPQRFLKWQSTKCFRTLTKNPFSTIAVSK